MSALSGHPRHLVVISADALSEDNWAAVSQLPVLSGLITHGCHTEELKSVLPTLTYVSHTTMVTGLYPDKHGVIHNNQFQPFVPEKEQTWYWYRDTVRGATLYDLARECGLSTAGLTWPVSGKSSIRYNLPEILAIKRENRSRHSQREVPGFHGHGGHRPHISQHSRARLLSMRWQGSSPIVIQPKWGALRLIHR